MSLQLLLAGLLPPKGTKFEWNENLNWQPIPCNYEDLNKDTLLLVRTPCPRYQEELQSVLTNNITDVIKANKELFENLTRITGLLAVISCDR